MEDPINSYTHIKDLRSGGEGKAILLEKNGKQYVCKIRVFETLNEANVGLKEAYSLATIIHQNTVKFEDVFIQASKDNTSIQLYIIMEYCPKGDLLDFLLEISPQEEQHSSSSSRSSSVSSGGDSTEDLESHISSLGERTTSQSSDISIDQSSERTTPPTPTTPPKHHHQQQQQQPPKQKKQCSLQNLYNRDKKCIIALTARFLGFGQHHQQKEEEIPSNLVKKDQRYLIEQNQLLNWLLDLAQGVQALHNHHLIHRDLKSENIFIASNNSLKIGDFGLAYKTTTLVTDTKGAVGTYVYSAPEVLENKIYDKSADIFSLGCIFYELITLRLLVPNRIYFAEELIKDTFCSHNFLSTFPTKYEKLGPIVLKMLDKNPTLRPSIENIIVKLNEMATQSSPLTLKRQISFKGIVRQVDKAQHPEVIELLANAMREDPRFRAIFSKKDTNLVPYLRKIFKNCIRCLSKNKATIWGHYAGDGRLISTSVWYNPDSKKGIKPSDMMVGGLTLLATLGIKRTARGGDLIKFINDVLTRENDCKHWFLSYVATDENFRNGGVGSSLLDPVLMWADHSQVKCKTLSFTKKAFPFFHRLGFEVHREIKQGLPKGLESAWILYREPKPLTT
eukprot:gene5171-6438_t